LEILFRKKDCIHLYLSYKSSVNKYLKEKIEYNKGHTISTHTLREKDLKKIYECIPKFMFYERKKIQKIKQICIIWIYIG